MDVDKPGTYLKSVRVDHPFCLGRFKVSYNDDLAVPNSYILKPFRSTGPIENASSPDDDIQWRTCTNELSPRPATGERPEHSGGRRGSKELPTRYPSR
jgi:hypothetical protein